MERHGIFAVGIMIVFTLMVSPLPGAHGQLWREFSHPGNPHDSLTIPLLSEAITDVTVNRPVLVVLMEFSDTTAQAVHNPAFWRGLIFGPAPITGPTVAQTFGDSSNGRYALVPATAGDVFDGNADGVVGWVKSSQSFFTLTDPSQKRAEAIRVADPLFNYHVYDTNNNGLITADELIVFPVFGDQSGNNCCDDHPGHPDLPGCIGCAGGNARTTDPPQVVVETGTPQEKRVQQLVAAVGEMAHVGTAAHEMAHSAAGHGDLYPISGCATISDGYMCNGVWYPPGPGHYSLMDDYFNLYVTHIEPWGKIHLGFVKPLIVTHDGPYTLYAAESDRQFSAQESQPEALIVYDPLRNNTYREYFILENRNLTGLPDQGLAVWLIDEQSSTWPGGLDWRRVVRFIRRGDYFTDASALWNGVDDTQGYDLTATSTPRNTNWADGSPSYIEIYDISPAGPVMTFKVRMPPIFVDHLNLGYETGSRDNPFHVINAAMDAISEPPRTLKIAGGSYPETMTISTPCTLTGWRNGNAVIGQ
jgi:M6 family metalloprotease-like protein